MDDICKRGGASIGGEEETKDSESEKNERESRRTLSEPVERGKPFTYEEKDLKSQPNDKRKSKNDEMCRYIRTWGGVIEGKVKRSVAYETRRRLINNARNAS